MFISDGCGIDQNGIGSLMQVEEICCSENEKIINLNHLQKLKNAIINGNCGINLKGIESLRFVEEICCHNNDKIINLNNLQNFKKLRALPDGFYKKI